MPPRKAKKNASTASDEGTQVDQTASKAVSKADEETCTPEQDPTKKIAAAGITQAQKQALIDNLQLEITERARKLRAQYAIQAQQLRERLEMRINRIPASLRNRKMQELMDEHAEKANPTPAPAGLVQEGKQIGLARKGLKRPSDQISTTSDEKENSSHDLANPKKRAKTAKTTTTNASNTNPSNKPTILSPKSHNPTTTTSRSPQRQAETQLPRPASPTKALPAPPLAKAEKAALTRKPSRQQLPTTSKTKKKNAIAPEVGEVNVRAEARSSDASITSAGTTTTVVRKEAAKGKVGGKKGPPAAAAGKGGAGGKKTAPAAGGAKKENAPPATVAAGGGGRSLRKRA